MSVLASHRVTPATMGFLVASAAAALAPVEAQQVTGRVVYEDTGLPVVQVFVILLDSSGVEHTRTLSDPFGRYLLVATVPGTYRLQTTIIGVENWTSDPFVLGPGGAQIEIVVPRRPIQLEALVVEGRRECRPLDPDSTAQVTRVWEEVRKALAAVTWSRETDSLRYRVVSYTRRVSPWGLKPLGGTTERVAGQSLGEPFESASPDTLSRLGYIHRDEQGVWRHYGPDASALLSEAFAGDHCFFLARHRDDPSLLGLGFEPARSRRLPDIAGVLWVDRATAQLRYLDFRYVNLPWRVDIPNVGGRVGFEQLASGHWIVRHWLLRMPVLITRSRFRGPTVDALRETGGYVFQLHLADGTSLEWTANRPRRVASLWVGPPAGQRGQPVVAGVVADAESGGPVGGATLIVRGADDSVRAVARSTSRGWFELRLPAAGRYVLYVAGSGYWPLADRLDVADADTVSLRADLLRLTRDARFLPNSAARTRQRVQFRRDSVLTLFSFASDDFATVAAATPMDVVAGVPGVRIEDGTDAPAVHLNEHRCAPSIFVDGFPSAVPNLLGLLPLSWIWAIEVFPTEGEIPDAYAPRSGRVRRCGAILVWTEALREDPPDV